MNNNGTAKNYNAKRDANPSQIIKEYNKTSFIEIIQPNDSFERVTINLVSLNPNNTQKYMISTYVDVPDFLTLCQRIACGRFGKMLERGKAIAMQNNSFPQEIWKRQGGKPQPNGAWKLTIHPATKSGDCLIQAVRGDGKQMENGLISITNTHEKVTVSLTHEILENIANISLMRIQAYIISRQMRGCYDYLPRTNKGEPEFQNQGFYEQPVGQSVEQPVNYQNAPAPQQTPQQVSQSAPQNVQQMPQQSLNENAYGGPVDFV